MYTFTEAASQYIHKINAGNFNTIALSLFRHQYAHNSVYRDYTNALHKTPDTISSVSDIPFLPVSFFKTHKVVARDAVPARSFESSGTTGSRNSQHHIFDLDLYEQALLKGFMEHYGLPGNYAVLALLPSYLERKSASLVYMAEVLMQKSGHHANGFYLNEWSLLQASLQQLEQQQQAVLLLGVTFALLDFAAVHPMKLNHTIVMETGGMKGRKEEWTRTQVHHFLKQQWQLTGIHSEYGMTEMLSQAYARRDGMFSSSGTMKVLVRDINDPLDVQESGSGCLNIIDLANVDSCAFIATEDIGTVHSDGSFEVLGRMDHSALRGCSLMAV